MPPPVESNRSDERAKWPVDPSDTDTRTVVHREPTANELTLSINDARLNDPTRGDSTIPIVPGYRLTEEIGHGGMGIVYRAHDEELHRDVAVKLLHTRYPIESSAGKRFVDEARITAQLQHPGIPPVYRVGHLPNGRPFLAMKLIKGQTLDLLLKAQGAGSAKWLGTFESLCQSLGYAHAHGVIHRDLKPTNVMVGAFGEVQVMDWGLAKVLTPQGANPKAEVEPDATAAPDPTTIKSLRDAGPFTQSGSILGTPAYMAPEQAIGGIEQIDQRTDVFGLGAILCTLLTGKPPYVGADAESTRQMAARTKLSDAFARLEATSAEPDLIALCKRCLSAEPADRPADANELAQAIATLRSAADDRARKAEIERGKAEVESREQRKRRRVVQWAGGLSAAVLLAGVVGTTMGLFEAKKQEAEARKQEGLALEEARKKEEARANEARQRVVAEANERKAEAAVDEAIRVLDVAVSEITGDSMATQKTISPEQKKLLSEVLPLYRRYLGENTVEQKPRERLARVAAQVGGIESRLGHMEEAATAYRQARDGYETLVADFPADPLYRHLLATCQCILAILQVEQGKESEAEGEYRKALMIREKLAADFPSVAIHRTQLAIIQNNFGNLLKKHGKLSEAELLFRKAIALEEKLVADFPNVPLHHEMLAMCNSNLELLLNSVGKPLESEGKYRQAIVIQKKQVAEFPTIPMHRHRLASSQYTLGVMLAGRGKPSDAEELYREAIVIQEKLVSDFPAVPAYRDDLAKSHHNLGHLLHRLGKPPEAVAEQFNKANVALEKLTADFPSVPDYRLSLAKIQYVIGHLQESLGKQSEAEVMYRKSIAVAEKLSGDFPANQEYRILLGQNYHILGNSKCRGGQLTDGVECHQKAIDTLRTVHEAEPRNERAKETLRDSHIQRALCHILLQKHGEAVKDWDRVVELSPKPEQKKHRAARASSKAAAGQIAEAVAEVAELCQLPDWNPDQLHLFASIYSLASVKISGRKLQYADAAMDLLKQAVKAGWKDAEKVRTNIEFAPLHERDDFKALLTEMEAKKPK